MKIRRATFAPVLAAVALVAGVGLYAQENAGQQAGQKGSEVFCSAKKTGQLCNHGTADLLKLSGAKRERWTEIVNRFNKNVEVATQELLKEAKAVLSPEEFAQVEAWFDKARNAELNKLLAGK
jgi:hypothetical protein